MTLKFDFIGLNTGISEAFKPLHHVTPASSRKAGMDAGIKGATPANCHHSYFASTELETEWQAGYRLGKQNRDEKVV